MRAKEFIFEAPSRFQPRQVYKLDNERMEELRQDPRVRVMLDLISRAEGNTNYDTIVGQPLPGGKLKPGGKAITDFSKHPEYIGLRTKHGPSDAAGRYQILSSTYRRQVEQLAKNGVEIKDFSPASQDKIAIAILNAVGALDPVLKGDYKQAVKLSNNQWVSLPGTKYSQGFGPKKNSWVDANVAELKKQYELEKKDTQVAQTKTEPSTIDKIKNIASNIIGPSLSPKTSTAKDAPQPKNLKPGYYAVGDSHAQGVGGYSGQQWTNLGQKGSSAFAKQHLDNIKNIPAGSVVTLSLGANDLGSAKMSDIVDQVNKTIAASKAQGHQVVYLLPTASSNPKLQQKREELRKALLKSLDSRDILDLGTAPSGKEVKGGDDVHLDPKGYKKYGEYITQMFTPGVKPKEPQPQSEPTKSVTTQAPPAKVTTEPPVTKTTKTEPSLVQQYVDVNKPNQLVKPKPEQKPEQPVKKKPEIKIDSPEYEKMMWDKQVAAGDKFSREREARLEKERLAKSKGLPIEPPITEPDLDPKGWAAYDAYMDKLQTEKGEKFSQEYQAAEKKAQSTPPQDDSYYTKFMNLFK